MPRKPSERFAVQAPGCTGNGVEQATFNEGLVALVRSQALKMADGSALLTGSDLDAWRDWRLISHRSGSEFQEAIALVGRVAPHTDPELKRKPQVLCQTCTRCERACAWLGVFWTPLLPLVRPPSEASWSPRRKGKTESYLRHTSCQ